MIKQSSMTLIIVFCLVQISAVISMNVGNNFDFPVNFQIPITDTNGYDDNRNENGRSTLDCTQFRRDYDILKSLPFPVLVSPLLTINKTFAIMNLTNHVTELTIYNEKVVPLNIYCLKNLNLLKIYHTNFYQYGLDDESIRTIPKEIGELKSLRILHIYDSLVEHLPQEFGKLDLLTEVHIVNGDLRDIPTVIENLSSLQSLKLSNNKLISLPSTIGKLRNLQYLWLDNNKITSLPSTMSSLISLITLHIQSNLFTSIDELNGMNRLQNLYAQNCKISYIPNNLSGLLNLNMSYNQLEDLFGIGGLGQTAAWKIFDFSHNQIDVIPPEISKIVFYLQMFSVNHNHLTHLPKELFNDRYSWSRPVIVLDISQNPLPLDELNTIKETVRTKIPYLQVIY